MVIGMISKKFQKKGICKAINSVGTCSALVLGFIHTPLLLAQELDTPLLSLSLEDLMQIEVTSISRRSQVLSDTSAAIYVITAADIAKSTAVTIPDLLRTVPGIEVAQQDANKWAVSARGFNSKVASKVLFIIDGRPVYSPLVGAVYWESEDLMLNNIERVEVIRGAGATIWGANALNGVISITTKSAHDTKGSYAEIHAASQNQQIANYRFGGEITEDISYRVYAKSKEHGGFKSLAGIPANDDWKSRQAGFRIDGDIGSNDSFTFMGDIVDQDIDQRQGLLVRPGSVLFNVDNPVVYTGMNAIARWEHRTGNASTFTTQVYYDYRDRDEIVQVERAETFDLDIKYTNRDDSRHNLTIGAGIRHSTHTTKDTSYMVHSPREEDIKLYNISLHDDFRLTEKAILGFGLKIENNIYTGTEYQPNIRLNYALTDNANAWVSLSRAVRTPSRGERDGEIALAYIPAVTNPLSPFDTFIVKQNNPTFDSEELESLEAGWRWSNGDNITFDLAAYYNRYSSLRSVANNVPYCAPDPFCMSPIGYVVQPVQLVNSDQAETRGAEGVAKWQVQENLSMELSYSYFEIDYHSSDTLFTQSSQSQESIQGLTPAREDPLYKYSLQTNWQINEKSQLNLVFRHVSEPGVASIADYDAVDIQYVWKYSDSFSVRFAGRNLGSGDHQEMAEVLLSSVPVFIEQSYSIDFRFNW